jgi:hypothetical protein
MAEKLSVQPEAPRQTPERQHNTEHHRSKEHPLKPSEARPDQQEQIKASREAVEHQAKSSQEMASFDAGSERTPTPPPTRELQDMAKNRLLKSIRRELPASQRALSKFVHAKPVETVSAVGEKTIARPYGLLGGGLAAFIGTALTFYMAKHYGFRYNLFLFFTFFIAGYVIATVIEVFVRAVRRSH